MEWFEVKVMACQTIAVEADDPSETARLAFASAFDMREECIKECQHPHKPVEGEELERLKRHADIVLEKG